MPYHKAHKQRTRRRILQSAYRLFIAQGFDATSIEEIMLDCKLTRGGFYAHFRSKSQLYREAIIHGAVSGDLPNMDRGDRLDSVLDEYLRVGGGSHAALLAADIASKEPEVRAACTHAFRQMIGALEAGSSSDSAILPAAAMIVGALAVSQTTDDAELKAQLLAVCKEKAQSLLAGRDDQGAFNFFWALDAAATIRRLADNA